MSNKIVVTGGYGFVGSYLTNLLLSQGFEVLVVLARLGAGVRQDTGRKSG